VKILLDTCSFLWFVNGERDKISKNAERIFLDNESEIYLSVVSCWEISIKWSINKLELFHPPNTFLKAQIQKNQLIVLPIGLEHSIQVAELPYHHKDPFDRLLISQSIVEQMPLLRYLV
jgi:PIN domain nuclease of toxin-antitoxin system